MTDALGFRHKLGIIAPSTNTAVQPEMDNMRPYGVTNHFGRFYIPDDPIRSDEDFNALMANIRATMDEAAQAVMTCSPDRLVLGMSSETFWGGRDGSKQLMNRMKQIAGDKPVTMGSDAVLDALAAYGNIKRIAVITPYMPPGDEQVVQFFNDYGLDVVTIKGLRGISPMLYSHISEKRLRDAINEVNGSDVQAIIQVGTNLCMARLAGIAEFWLDKPVIAINTAIYWHALRNSGIDDRVSGYGSLFLEH